MHSFTYEFECILLLQLNGFVDRYFDPTLVGGPSQYNSPLMLIETFIHALTNCDKDGRIVVTKSG